MIFSSFHFLFVFLPINLAVYYFCSARNYTSTAKLSLIFGSLVFYAWSGLRFLPLVVASVCVNYAVGLCMRRRRRWRRSLFWAGIAFNLGLLGFFKYAAFVSVNMAALFGQSFFAQAIVLPLAISFFTFQQIAYLTEIHRGDPAAASFVDYALFILFFPHLIAGPITPPHRDAAAVRPGRALPAGVADGADGAGHPDRRADQEDAARRHAGDHRRSGVRRHRRRLTACSRHRVERRPRLHLPAVF